MSAFWLYLMRGWWVSSFSGGLHPRWQGWEGTKVDCNWHEWVWMVTDEAVGTDEVVGCNSWVQACPAKPAWFHEAPSPLAPSHASNQEQQNVPITPWQSLSPWIPVTLNIQLPAKGVPRALRHKLCLACEQGCLRRILHAHLTYRKGSVPLTCIVEYWALDWLLPENLLSPKSAKTCTHTHTYTHTSSRGLMAHTVEAYEVHKQGGQQACFLMEVHPPLPQRGA